VRPAPLELPAPSGAGHGRSLKFHDARANLCDVKTVRKWRDRFAAVGLEGLWDAPRSGRPPEFTATQRHDVFAALAGPPPFPYARWTVDLLANHLVDQGIVPSIGRETVSLWLRSADVKPHRVKYWLTSKDPKFTDRDVGRILVAFA